MDVRDQGHLEADGTQPPLDLADRLGIGGGRGGDAYDLAAGLHQADGLGQRGLHVLGTGGGHGLDTDGLSAAHGDRADLDFATLAALVDETARAIRRGG